LRHHGVGDRPGARAELDDRPGDCRIDVARHGARERLARRGHRADRERLLDPGAEKPDLIVEADAVPLFEAADLAFKLLSLRLELLFESSSMGLELQFELRLVGLDLLFDLSFEPTPFELEQADLPLDLLLKDL